MNLQWDHPPPCLWPHQKPGIRKVPGGSSGEALPQSLPGNPADSWFRYWWFHSWPSLWGWHETHMEEFHAMDLLLLLVIGSNRTLLSNCEDTALLLRQFQVMTLLTLQILLHQCQVFNSLKTNLEPCRLGLPKEFWFRNGLRGKKS